jgi:hypothetical protein
MRTEMSIPQLLHTDEAAENLRQSLQQNQILQNNNTIIGLF